VSRSAAVCLIPSFSLWTTLSYAMNNCIPRNIFAYLRNLFSCTARCYDFPALHRDACHIVIPYARVEPPLQGTKFVSGGGSTVVCS
jgi:hypothetical protein